MGDCSNDDHDQLQPGDMDPTDPLLTAFRNVAASYRSKLPTDDAGENEDAESRHGDAPAPPPA